MKMKTEIWARIFRSPAVRIGIAMLAFLSALVLAHFGILH